MYSLWWLQLPRVLLQISGCWKGKQDPRTHSSMSWHVGTARDRSQNKPDNIHRDIFRDRLNIIIFKMKSIYGGFSKEGVGLGRLR